MQAILNTRPVFWECCLFQAKVLIGSSNSDIVWSALLILRLWMFNGEDQGITKEITEH